MTTIDYLPEFSREIKNLKKKNLNFSKDLANLILSIEKNPKQGQSLGNNLYKIRLQNSSNNKGKSVGYRVITYYLSDDNLLYLVEIYSKNKQENILKDELIKRLKSYNLI